MGYFFLLTLFNTDYAVSYIYIKGYSGTFVVLLIWQASGNMLLCEESW